MKKTDYAPKPTTKVSLQAFAGKKDPEGAILDWDLGFKEKFVPRRQLPKVKENVQYGPHINNKNIFDAEVQKKLFVPPEGFTGPIKPGVPVSEKVQIGRYTYKSEDLLRQIKKDELHAKVLQQYRYKPPTPESCKNKNNVLFCCRYCGALTHHESTCKKKKKDFPDEHLVPTPPRFREKSYKELAGELRPKKKNRKQRAAFRNLRENAKREKSTRNFKKTNFRNRQARSEKKE